MCDSYKDVVVWFTWQDLCCSRCESVSCNNHRQKLYHLNCPLSWHLVLSLPPWHGKVCVQSSFSLVLFRYMQLVSVVPTDPSVLSKLGELYDSEQDKSQAFQYHFEVRKLKNKCVHFTFNTHISPLSEMLFFSLFSIIFHWVLPPVLLDPSLLSPSTQLTTPKACEIWK